MTVRKYKWIWLTNKRPKDVLPDKGWFPVLKRGFFGGYALAGASYWDGEDFSDRGWFTVEAVIPKRCNTSTEATAIAESQVFNDPIKRYGN